MTAAAASGTVDLDVAPVLSAHVPRLVGQARILEVFQAFDRGRNGYIREICRGRRHQLRRWRTRYDRMGSSYTSSSCCRVVAGRCMMLPCGAVQFKLLCFELGLEFRIWEYVVVLG